MNTTIKNFGLIALGGVIGGLVGYFLSDLIIDQIMKYEEDFYDWEENKDESVRVGKSRVIDEVGVSVKDYTKFVEKGDLNELAKPYVASKLKEDNIHVISVEEYESIAQIEEITYYKDDNTFCDENEEIISNPEDLFGVNIHLHFGEESKDPDIVYVKNDNNGVCYEITQLSGKYSVIVLGLPDEEKPKPKRQRRTKNTKKADEEDEMSTDEGED